MIDAIRSKGQPYFYNDYDGVREGLTDEQGNKIVEINYRIIEHNLKNNRFIRFTHKDIEKLNGEFLKITTGDFDNIASGRGSLAYSRLKKSNVIEILDFLYKVGPKLFDPDLVPTDADLQIKSFFERKEDAGSIMARVFSLCNFGRDPEIRARLIAFHEAINSPYLEKAKNLP